MSMVEVSPTRIQVACDLFSGTPRTIRAAGDVIPVLELERVRDESRAYPVATGPRTIFVVRTPSARLRLSFTHRDRSWAVVGVDPIGSPVRLAA